MSTQYLQRDYRIHGVPAGSAVSVNLGIVRGYTPFVPAYDVDEEPNGAGGRQYIQTNLQNGTVEFTLQSFYPTLGQGLLRDGTVFAFEQSSAQPGSTGSRKHWMYFRGYLLNHGAASGNPGEFVEFDCQLAVRQYLEGFADQVQGATQLQVIRALDNDTGVHVVGATTALLTPPTSPAFGPATIVAAAALTGVTSVVHRGTLGTGLTDVL